MTDFDFAGSDSDENVVAINGNGYINDTEGRKDKLLKFDKVPYTFTAALEDAGDMYIEIGADGPYVITSDKSML